MRDLRTKLALGMFLLTIVFCLLALRVVNQDMEPAQVPHLTVTTALVLSLVCVLVLVFFLHVMSRSIVADEVIRRVAAELDATIESLPDLEGEAKPVPAHAELLPADFEQGSAVLRSEMEGYVQEVRYERLVDYASRADLLLRVDVAAGDYVFKQGGMGRVYPASRCSADKLQFIRDGVVLGRERTPVQDLAFVVRHLVDVGLRALSAALNDANTALAVIDRLNGALARLLRKSLPTGVFYDEAGRCRLVGRRRTHAQVVAEALRPIRDAAASQPLVIVAMLRALAKLAEHAREKTQFEFLREEGRLIAEVALSKQPAESERRAICEARDELERKLA
jgi:uncharacterized membrane protein